MEEIIPGRVTSDKLVLPVLAEKNVAVDILRLDKIHPLVSGNKWFKLRYYLEEAKKENKKTIVTYGGAWSNHILATAEACKIYNLNCIGLIRGEEPTILSSTLIQSKKSGMRLIFMSREEYRVYKIPEELNNHECYFIPEGGYGAMGVKGASTILDYCEKQKYTHICCAAGTGTMTAGLINSSLFTNKIIAISVLKNNLDLENDIRLFTSDREENFQLIHDYHFGGYAKYKPALIDFMNNFYRQTTIASDFVYTGKLFFAVNDLISNNFFDEESKLIVIHSGGLQGNASLSNGTLIF